MDDDDSQDELINRNTSHSKGKRAALWAISDDSDDVEEESEEGESDSGDEEEDDRVDGEEEEEEDDDEEEEDDEEEDAKAEEGAFAGTSADLAGMSSDEDADKCPICLNSFNSQPVATPESCEHYFCLDCILEWAKNANSCPVDRIAFNTIYLRTCFGGKVQKMITVQKPVKEGQEERVDLDLEQTSCEVCGGSDREDRLLLCDGCDAGYHMECLTPPLDSVPVEEWFCPECEANNRHSRGSAEEVSDTESLPSTARPATSRSRVQAPTRAIARTQQSERVRANVNRHRITQARTSQLAPTYLIQSTWLDDTINAVVAGLNTSVYIRDFTPRLSSGHRRKAGKRRKVKRRKTSAATGKKGKVASTGVKRRKRKVRRTSKKMMSRKITTPRDRIASSLGMAPDRKGSSLPTVYRPSEHTLSGMRADIGAASLSIYGDPSDLDPFVDCEDKEPQASDTSLLEAKRRGISHSAFRSHQPVARPVTASLSRGGLSLPRSRDVVEAAPVPDLLGSILSGQSMLLMDSSDVVINRDGSLKTTKPTKPATITPGCSKISSGDASTRINRLLPPSQGDNFLSPHYRADVPQSSHRSMNRPPSQGSSHFSSHVQPSTPSLPQGHPRLQPPAPVRPTAPLAHPPTSRVRISRVPSSSHSSENHMRNGIAPSHSQMPKEVKVLPRIPKINREGSIKSDCSHRSISNRGHRANSASTSNGFSMPDMGVSSLAGDEGRQQSVDHQNSRKDGQRQKAEGASSSSTFSKSFASSSTSPPAGQARCSSSSSSSSSAVSFRINSSGGSWHSRRLSIGSSSASEGNVREPCRDKMEEARKRQLHRDKQMLLASRTTVRKDQDSNNIYDPFNPTLSDSSCSDNEAGSSSLDGSFRHIAHDEKPPCLASKEGLTQSKPVKTVEVKTETQNVAISEEEPRRASTQETRLPVSKIKKEPELDEPFEEFSDTVKHIKSETPDNTLPVHPSASMACKEPSVSSSAAPGKKKQKAETKSDSKSSHKSPSSDSGAKRKSLQASVESCPSSSETDRSRKGDHHASGQGSRQKEKVKDKERSSRRSRSRERRRAHSTSESSQSNSPERSRGKRRRSRSRSKDRRRQRSGSSSSSRERSRGKKDKHRYKDRSNGKEKDRDRRLPPKDRRRGHSRSRSVSKSRSRSRSTSRERKREHAATQQSSSRGKEKPRSKDKRRHRSRSSSRERGEEREPSNKRSHKSAGSSVSSSKDTRHQEDRPQPSVKKVKEAVAKKEAAPSSVDLSKVKTECNDVNVDTVAQQTDTVKHPKIKKEMKEEPQESVDMFQDSPRIESTVEAAHVHSATVRDQGNQMCPLKIEPCEVPITKPEPSAVEVCPSPPAPSVSTLTTPVMSHSPQDTVSQPHPMLAACPEQPDTAGSTVPAKQEVVLLSDSDDDFSVDLMLDNLDYVKSKPSEGNDPPLKQEAEAEEWKNEATGASAKSKAPTKRVTWNIQEPEGPQAAKSASKLALYKLKMKAEGARKPSLTGQSQDVSGAASTAAPAEVEEGGLSKDDIYLKKLHMQERAVEEVKLAIKPFYQRRDINKDEYKEILRKAVQKVCHSKSGEINPVKVGNLVKAYVEKYKYDRKHKDIHQRKN